MARNVGAALLLLACSCCESQEADDVQIVIAPNELGSGRPRGLHVDDTHIYWSQAGNGIRRRAKSGGQIETVATYMDLARAPVVSDSHFAFWLQKDQIDRLSLSSGEVTSFPLEGEYTDVSPTHDDDHVYFARFGCTELVRFKKDGTGTSKWPVNGRGDLGGSTRVLVDEQTLHCSNRQWIYSLPKGGGDASVFVDGQRNIGAMAHDSESLSWIDNAASLTNDKVLMRVSKDGGVPEVMLQGQRGAAGVLLRDPATSFFYWVRGVSDGSAVRRYNPRSGTVVDVVSNRSMQGGLAADDDFVYWTEVDRIARVPK